MTRRAAIAGAFLLAAARAFGFDWPVAGGAFSWGFGSARDGFFKGAEFSGQSIPVRASESGELFFAASGNALPGGYPIDGGSLLALYGERGLVTVYSGLDESSISRYLIVVKAGDVLGRTPRLADARGFRFFVYDAKERRYLNPLSVMPPIADQAAPAIRSITLYGEDGEVKPEQAKAVRQGSYFIIVDAFDLTPGGKPGAPFELTVTIDGSVKAKVTYDAAWAADGVSRLFGAGATAEPAFLAGGNRVKFGPFQFPRGRLSFSVAAADFYGNRREQGFVVAVQ